MTAFARPALNLKHAVPTAPKGKPIAAPSFTPQASRHSEATVYPEAELAPGLSAQIVLITPALAAEWLATREGGYQRRVRPRHKRKLVADLLAGRFVLNGEPLIFDRDGRLTDGQHRLEAVVDSKTSYWSFVIRGLDPSVFKTIDAGTSRTGSDTLRSVGYSNVTALAAACNFLYAYQSGSITNYTPISAAHMEEIAEAHPGLIESVEVAHRCKKTAHAIAIPAVCHYLFKQRDANLAEQFFHKLATGEELSRGDAVLTLRNKLDKDPKIGRTELMVYFVKCWNAYRKGKALHALKWSPEIEEFPAIV